MTTSGDRVIGMERKALLSTMWIFVVLNYLYCDVASLMDAGSLKQYLAGNVGGMEMTQGFLLGAADANEGREWMTAPGPLVGPSAVVVAEAASR